MNPVPTGKPTAIEVSGVTKSYADQPVLRGIDLTVPTGTVYALLGPNGAGKTTMVRILSTLISADGGDARIAGHDVRTQPDQYAAPSASPGSSPRSTSCSPAGRTSG